MAADRCKSPERSRGKPQKKQRCDHRKRPKAEKDSHLDSRSSISSSRSSSSSSSTTCVPVLAPSSIAPLSTRHRHDMDNHCDDNTHHSHSSHRRRKHHCHHHRKALPAPDEEDEKVGYPTTVAVREKLPVQTVLRTPQRDLSPDEEEVYDHRNRPLSRHHRSRYPERHREQSESQKAKTAGRGCFVAAVMVLVSLVMCMGEAD